MAKHSLDLHDRGDRHIHRWLPICSCGTWKGVPLRDRGRAAEEYHRHVKNAEREAQRATVTKVKRSSKHRAGRRVSSQGARPRPLTPVEDLPPELR